MRKVGLLTRAMDYVLKPQIVDFAWKKALKSSQADVLVGAKQAAAVVSDSLIAAVGGDDAQFQRLAESRALQHDLVLALREEKDRGIKLGLQQEMDEYLRLQRRHLEGSATVLQTRLVVGLDRRAFAAADAVLKLTVGTTLIVLATAEERGDRQLWWQNVQQALLHERGCTAGNPRRRRPAIQVQARVQFEDRVNAVPTAPQTYVFEASLQGRRLLVKENDDDDEVSWQIVDMNDMLQGNEYWKEALDTTTEFPRFF